MIPFRLQHDLKTSLWLVPLLFMLGAGVLHAVTVLVDPRGELVPPTVSGDAQAATQMLYLISFAMLTLTGLVLSLVVVVVQLATDSFSPRIVRQILQDRPSQCVIGLFAGTFIHSILTLRVVRTVETTSVPGLAVVVALACVLVCMAALVWYINHIGQSLRSSALVTWVAGDTVKVLDRQFPPDREEGVRSPDLLTAGTGGVLFRIDHDRLLAHAERQDCCFELCWALGDYVPSGADLLRVHGDGAGLSRAKVLRSLSLGPERTLNQDVAYGLRMLVDVATRTISAGPFEDPTTAVQAINAIHEVLRELAGRRIGDGRYHDGAGVVRLVVPTMTWAGYVRLAFDEIRQAGAASPQVVRRLRAALDDLLTVAPAERCEPLREQLRLLEELSARQAPTRADQVAVTVADHSGLGSGRDLVVSAER